jgi:hypothetical protein
VGPRLVGYCQDALTVLNVLRLARRCEPDEAMNGRQAGIPRGDTVLSVAFEMIQKCQDLGGADVIKRQIDDITPMPCGEIAEQQDERIAIAQHRARAEAAREGEVLRKERAEGRRERRRGRSSHCPPPSRISDSQDAHWVWKRSLAASTVAGKNVR